MCYTKKMKYIVISTSRNICLKSQLVGIESQVYSFGMFNWLTGIQNITCMARVSICVGKVALRLLVWVESRWEWSGAYNNKVSFWKVKKIQSLWLGCCKKMQKSIAFCFAAAVSVSHLWTFSWSSWSGFSSWVDLAGMELACLRQKCLANNFDFSILSQKTVHANTSMSSWYRVKLVQNINRLYIDSFNETLTILFWTCVQH